MNGAPAWNNGKLSNLPLAIPSSLKLPVPKQGPPGARQRYKWPALKSQYSSGNNGDNIVRFQFNNTGIIDFERGALSFDLTITAPGATYARVANGIWSIFNRLRVSVGQELDDILEYNRVVSWMYESFRQTYTNQNMGEIIGFGTQSQRDLWGSIPAKNYMSYVISGLMLTGPIPMGKLRQKLQYDFYIGDPSTFIETDSAGPIVVTLDNPYFYYDVLTLNPASEMEFFAAATSGVRYPYKSWTFYQTPMTAAQADIPIPHSSSAIDAFINLLVRNDNVNVTTDNDKFLEWQDAGAVQYQLRVNNTFYPPEPIQCGDNQSYHNFLNYIEGWSLGIDYKSSPVITYSAFINNRAQYVIDVRAFPGDGLVNNFSTNNAGNVVFLRLQFSGAPANPSSVFTLVQTTKTIDFSSGLLSQ